MPEEPSENPLEGLLKGLFTGLERSLGDLDLRDLGGFDANAEPNRDRERDADRPRGERARRTPTLNRYGRDLTSDARAHRLDPVIGRDAEVAQVLEVLCRRAKNNPVLIGDPGVGKTAIVEGIAARIAEGNVPAALRDRRLVALDLARMVAGTKYRGEFEQRFTAMLDEVLGADRGVLLFLDELHTLVGAGSGEGVPLDAGNMLKPALARGGLQLIGATTVEEYRKHLGGDPALERRLQPIQVAEASVADTVAILRGLRGRYEAHHGVRIGDTALEAAARLADRYLTERFLPDKAIDLVDRASARVRLRASATDHRQGHVVVDAEGVASVAAGEAEVTPDEIASVTSDMTGVPVARLTELDRHRLLHLEQLLAERVVGRPGAITAVADAVRAGRAGLAHPERPVGSLLFLGPSGVGKTELARALAGALFDSDERLVRLDMTEFGERHAVSRLIGAPPGYLGHDEPGRLTESVRRTPYTVLLLDEIEKAHPDVLNVLLQVLDAGRLTDARGRTADFTNAVIIMTSNIGAETLLAAAVAGRRVEDVRDTLLGSVRARFRPEFVNRIDETVLFRGLGRAELRAIAGLALEQTRERLRAQDVELAVDDSALDWLAEHGYLPEFGARPLRRVVRTEVERPLARLLLSGELGPGRRVRVSVVDGGLAIG